MAFKLRMLGDCNIIELCLEGVVNIDECLETKSQMCAMCEKHGPLTVLVDIRKTECGMSTSRIYEFASTIEHPLGASIALLSRPNDTDARFFETVALNNGVPIKLFTEYSEALAFLTESP